MTPATAFHWSKALNNWMVARVDVNDTVLPIFKKGRTIAVPASFLAASLGLKPNRFTLGTYAERMKNRIVDIQIGSGVSNYKGGVAKCIYLSQLYASLVSCNVPIKNNQAYKNVLAVLEAARESRVDEVKADESRESHWVTGPEAQEAWEKTLEILRRTNMATASLLAASASGWAYSKKAGVMNVTATSTTVNLMRTREDRLNEALTEALGCQMRAAIYHGNIGVGVLEHLGPAETADEDDDIPFDGPEAEPTEEELEQAVSDCTDRDLINALGSLVAGVDKRVEELAEGLGTIEKKLDKFALLTARRNFMLSQILARLSEVINANLYTPEENSKGTWRGSDD